MLDGEYSAVIAGVLHEVENEYDFDGPLFSKIPSTHKLFVVDPRRTQFRFARGFEAGFNIARAANRIQKAEADEITGHLGRPFQKGSRHMLSRFTSRELEEEVRAAKITLAEEGARGFQNPKVQRAGGASLYLAGFSPQVRQIPAEHRKTMIDEVLDMTDVMLAMCNLDMKHVPVGELIVSTGSGRDNHV